MTTPRISVRSCATALIEAYHESRRTGVAVCVLRRGRRYEVRPLPLPVGWALVAVVIADPLQQGGAR